jgi:transposase
MNTSKTLNPEKRNPRRFDDNFKREVAHMVTVQGLTVNQVCREKDIGKTAVRRWIKQFGIEGTGQLDIDTAGRRIHYLEDENRRLCKLVESEKAANACQEADLQRLQGAIELLPKALALFLLELRRISPAAA